MKTSGIPSHTGSSGVNQVIVKWVWQNASGSQPVVSQVRIKAGAGVNQNQFQ